MKQVNDMKGGHHMCWNAHMLSDRRLQVVLILLLALGAVILPALMRGGSSDSIKWQHMVAVPHQPGAPALAAVWRHRDRIDVLDFAAPDAPQVVQTITLDQHHRLAGISYRNGRPVLYIFIRDANSRGQLRLQEWYWTAGKFSPHSTMAPAISDLGETSVALYGGSVFFKHTHLPVGRSPFWGPRSQWVMDAAGQPHCRRQADANELLSLRNQMNAGRYVFMGVEVKSTQGGPVTSRSAVKGFLVFCDLKTLTLVSVSHADIPDLSVWAGGPRVLAANTRDNSTTLCVRVYLHPSHQLKAYVLEMSDKGLTVLAQLADTATCHAKDGTLYVVEPVKLKRVGDGWMPHQAGPLLVGPLEAQDLTAARSACCFAEQLAPGLVRLHVPPVKADDWRGGQFHEELSVVRQAPDRLWVVHSHYELRPPEICEAVPEQLTSWTEASCYADWEKTRTQAVILPVRKGTLPPRGTVTTQGSP